MTRLLTWITAAILFGTAVYYFVLAVGPNGIGPLPGDGPPGETVVGLLWVLATLVGGVLAVVYAVRPRRPGPVHLLAPASAVSALVSFYTFDPYYAPGLRRYSDYATGAATWTWFVFGIAVAVGAVALRHRRLGAALTPFSLLLSLVTGVLVGSGH